MAAQTGAFDPNPKAGTGLLYAKDGRISIGRSADHADYGKLDQAVQVGPLLVDPGGRNGIRSTGGEHASRATVCLTSDDQVAVIVTTDGIYRYDIGLLLSRPAADGGLGCERAINLDGEPSTQAVFIDAEGKAQRSADDWPETTGANEQSAGVSPGRVNARECLSHSLGNGVSPPSDGRRATSISAC